MRNSFKLFGLFALSIRRSFAVSDTLVGRSCCEALARCFQPSTRLECLVLDSNSFGDKGAEAGIRKWTTLHCSDARQSCGAMLRVPCSGCTKWINLDHGLL